MKIISALFACLVICLFIRQTSFAQKVTDFEKDFKNASASDFDSSQVQRLLQNYSGLLTPFNQVTQLSIAMRGEEYMTFPLGKMRGKPLYEGSIDKLLQSAFPDNRLLAYLLIGSSGDTTRRDMLEKRLETETDPNCSLWLGMVLMYTGFDKASVFFKWMVKNNSEAGNFLFPMFMSFPADSLRKIAYQYASGEDWNERIYAVQMLMNTGYAVRTDTILKDAIRHWPLHLKGYAVIPAQNTQLGNLLPVLKPLLDSTLTRKISLDALADSPTIEDRTYVVSLAEKTPSQIDVLESLRSCRHPEMVKHWFSLIVRDNMPDSYGFSVYRDSLLYSDSMLPYVHESLKNIKKPGILSSLVPVLKGRTDTLSQNLLIDLITHSNSNVRYYASDALSGHFSDRLKSVLAKIVKDTICVTANTFDLAVGCKLATLQSEAEFYYKSANDHMIGMNALNYLAVYPQKKHLALFRKLILENTEENTQSVRIAAKGLAELHDASATDAIIKASNQERKKDDSNCLIYLESLGKLKNDKAKQHIKSFSNSSNQQIKSTVVALLKLW